MRLTLSGGDAHDVTAAADLLDGQVAGAVSADKAYGTNDVRQMIERANAEAVIPSKRTRKIIVPHDAVAHTLLDRIERFFDKPKHSRRIATRYDRLETHFLAPPHLASSIIWMRQMSFRRHG